jgi:hypothetical protein
MINRFWCVAREVLSARCVGGRTTRLGRRRAQSPGHSREFRSVGNAREWLDEERYAAGSSSRANFEIRSGISVYGCGRELV